MMKELDVPSTRDQKVFVFHMNNGDPQQARRAFASAFALSTALAVVTIALTLIRAALVRHEE